jgi:type II secretory pathway pseudopilin PulG
MACIMTRKCGVRLIGQGALVLAAILVVAGCNREAEIKRSALHSNHVSPPPVAVPQLPAGSFDQAKAQDEVQAAAAARQAGDSARARSAAEAAVAHWPADLAAWDELTADCTALKDDLCQRYAEFFHAKVDFVDKLPPRIAVLGFASLADNPVGTQSGDYVYDRRTLDTALRLASFYDEQDQLRDVRLAAHPSTQPPAKPPKPKQQKQPPDAAQQPPPLPNASQ